MQVQSAQRDPSVVINEWREAQAVLAKAKETELRLRNEILTGAFGFDGVTLREGTENYELLHGFKLKAVFKANYKLDNTADAVDRALTRIEKAGPEGQFVASRLVKWEPKLSVSEYRKLEPKYQKIIDDVLTITEGTPSLEIVPPKA